MSPNAIQGKTLRLPMVAKYSDIGTAVAAVVIMGMMIMPLPEWALDVLLPLNVAVSLTILLVTVYINEPLEFSSFPSMLLVATLFRLALNIAVTRSILINASAGSVVSAFGTVVVGGNYVVGIVIFAILIIVQFIVITNGTGRVAEVAARFTLDAMPGKQMAIDADLNAGIIDDREATRRRQAVAKEADFYGAMDGSSKFIRGDTIAAIIMIVVNILGGFIVGVAQHQMDFIQALQTYTLLTIGEGLITQIPGLLISSAAGLMVTKTASDSTMGVDVANQLLSQPKALNITAGISVMLALIPGIPKLPFLIIAAGAFAVGRTLKQQQAMPVKAEADKVVANDAPKAPESMTDLLSVDPIQIELGYGLVPLADPKQGGDLLERITSVRRQAAIELGLLVPAIRVRDNVQLKPNNYVIKLRGIEIAQGEIYTGHLLAMNPGTASMALHGIDTVEPAFGLPAIWIADMQQAEAEMSGYTVVDPLTVLITHITETIRRNAAEVLTRQDTQVLVDTCKGQSPAVVSDLIPEVLSLGDVQKVLQNLLAERVSIRDMVTILEALGDAARITRDIDSLTDYARQALARQITAQYQSPDGTVRVFTLDPTLEQMIADGIRHTEMGGQLVLEPVLTRRVLEAVRAQTESMAAMGYNPVALCSPRTRIHFRRLIERMIPTLAVISFNELAQGAGLETVGMVDLTNENA